MSQPPAGERQLPLPYASAQARIEARWQELAADPQAQALDCARLCMAEAVHLAGWLENKIYRQLPDNLLKSLLFAGDATDGRIEALNLLAAARQTRPQPPSKPAHAQSGLSSPLPRQADSRGLIPIAQPIADMQFCIVSPQLRDRLRTDPELGRVCVGVNKAAEFRLYVIARELTRLARGSGKVNKADLLAALAFYGISYTRRHFNRLLKAGDGLFWRLTPQHLYISNPGRLAAILAQIAPELFTTNRPGVRDVYLSPTGSLAQWEASLYAGWMCHREAPTISRAALEKLFNRSPDTLRRWEQERLSGALRIRTNYAQCSDPTGAFFDHLPEHSQPYLANIKFNGQWSQQARVYWQLPNSYHTQNIRQHPNKGQASKVRKAVSATLDGPADRKRGGDHVSRRYFDNARHLKDYTAKHHTIGYLWRGENRHQAGVFEINRNGFPQTYARERAGFAQEEGYFRIERQQVAAWLRSQPLP